MPILLENLDTQETLATLKSLQPKFFSKSLTGQGGKIGLLNANRLPARNANTAQVSPQRVRDIKTTISSGTSDYEFIPTMLADMPNNYKVKKLPDFAECVSADTVPDDSKVYMYVTMHDMVLQTTDKGLPTMKKTLYCMYIIRMYTATANPDEFKCSEFIEPALNTNQFVPAYKNINAQLLEDYFGGLMVYDIVLNTVNEWTNHIPDLVETIIDNQLNSDVLRTLCIRLNNYPVNLMDYRNIYDIIEQKRPDALPKVTEVNLNLLLNAVLKTLDANKANIKMFNSVPWNQTTPKLSNEQLRAVCTTEPCCIVQAGAGTGKSTVINNRIKYLKFCGVDLSNVMVLSFTNAAADHIKDIAPEVNSKTIASMIHDIYAMNYDHQLSTIDTMLNILRATKTINNRNNIVGFSLINALQLLKKDINSGLIELSNLVSNHFDDVINILNTIRQTTLELESIICYHAKNLVEPNNLCEHLIMDEVQDNSIFEFIYIINYVVRHNASLYLVGDCSQTLYEFRASNPKALNCLEMSGVFQCMQLQTNYRSNQNILDFANLTLNTIEANQFAKIQLHANSFQKNAFHDDVKVEYFELLNKTRALKDKFPSMISKIKPWIDDKLAKGEQIAFLSYKRDDLTMFEDVITKIYPNNSLVNIVPAKCFNNSFFSKYILNFGDDFTHTVGNDVTVEIMRHIINNIDSLCRTDAQKAALRAVVTEWRNSNYNTFIARDAAISNGVLTEAEFKEEVFLSLIDFEIDKNAMKQRLISAANEKMKAEDVSSYNFVMSTIHSAKGLEFQNVILLYDESKKNEEEDKRMYYVGLTRAMSSECVLAFNTTKGSEIKSAYDIMCQAQAAAMNAAQTQTTTSEDKDDTSDTENASTDAAQTVTTDDDTEQ